MLGSNHRCQAQSSMAAQQEAALLSSSIAGDIECRADSGWQGRGACRCAAARGPRLPLGFFTTPAVRAVQAMGEYIKGKGLKFGIYSDAGNLTCAKYPGSLGYEKEDAQTFASWGKQSLRMCVPGRGLGAPWGGAQTAPLAPSGRTSFGKLPAWRMFPRRPCPPRSLQAYTPAPPALPPFAL